MVDIKIENETKRKRNDNENGSTSVTSPLSKKNDVKEPVKTYVGNVSLVDLGSESYKQTIQQSKVQNGFSNDWNPKFSRPTNYDINEGLLAPRVITLETNVQSRMTSLEELKEMIKKTSCAHNTPPSRVSYDKNVEEVLKKLFEDKYMCQKSDDDCKEINPKQSVRKLFSTRKGGNTSPIVVTKTPMGYTVPHRKGKQTPSKLDGPSIPKWLSLMFQPKRRMKLNEEECNLAIYIFGCPPNEEIDKEEIIAASEYWAHHVTRKLLLDLKPNKFITGDVIDLAACMLTYDARKEMRRPKTWFMPTTFTRYVLSWNSPFGHMKRFYQKKFMGNANVVSKIFLPIHDHLHWFLLVIDFVTKELVYLDSYQSSSVLHGRITSIKKLSMFMEELLMDPSFHATDSNHDRKITEFKIVTPKDLGRQGEGSNDCAVWVINWMMQRGENRYKIEVDEGSRLKIALQLTRHPFNDKRDLMLAKSLEHKQDFIKGNDSKLN